MFDIHPGAIPTRMRRLKKKRLRQETSATSDFLKRQRWVCDGDACGSCVGLAAAQLLGLTKTQCAFHVIPRSLVTADATI